MQLFPLQRPLNLASRAPQVGIVRSLLRVGRWAAQDHTAGRWESWDETRVCLVPLSARSMVLCCLWGLSSFGIYTSTQRLLRCLLLGHLPREITVSVLEGGLNVPEQREADERRG